MLDKDASLAEKIRMLFQENQGIMIASILMATGMAVGVLAEALFPSEGGEGGTVHNPPPKDEKGVKE